MRLLLLLLGLLLAPPPARRPGFDLPGLTGDAAGLPAQLARRFPAGATPQQRAPAEQRAAQAERPNNWAAAAPAWEERVAGGEARPSSGWRWPGRSSPHPAGAARALQAAWCNFRRWPGGAPEIPSLLLMAEALAAARPPGAADRRR